MHTATASDRVNCFLNTNPASEKMVEIQLSTHKAIQAVDQFGIGRATKK